MVKSAQRAILILEAIAQANGGLTHTEISRALDIPSGSLTPLLNTLSNHGYICLDQSNKRYVLGPGVLFLARRYHEGIDIAKIGQPLISQLVRLTGESAAVAIANGNHVTIVAKENCTRPLRPSLELGDRAPLYAGASGKIFLAYRSDEEIKEYLSSVELRAFTQNTTVDPEQIWREIRGIRAGDLSYSRESLFDGVTAIAAPALDLNGKVVACLTVIAPTIRLGDEKEKSVEKALRDASAVFSERLGFGHDHGKDQPFSGGELAQTHWRSHS